MAESAQKVIQEIGKLAPSAIIELFELDLSKFDEDSLYFHAGTNEVASNIVFQSKIYSPLPVEVKGFEFKGKGELPRPTVVFANVTGALSLLALEYDDLVGAKFIRRRTFVRYLDAVNFPDGRNPSADATAEFPPDTFYVDRKTRETKSIIEFELASSLDVEGVMLPKRQVIANTCSWVYRSAECGFAEDRVVGSIRNENLVYRRVVDANGRPRYKGLWKSDQIYIRGDLVDHEGATYVALVSGSITHPPDWGWDELYANRFRNFVFLGHWRPELVSAAISKGQIKIAVEEDDEFYILIGENGHIYSPKTSTVWMLAKEWRLVSYRGEWREGTYYRAGDIVSYENSYYFANALVGTNYTSVNLFDTGGNLNSQYWMKLQEYKGKWSGLLNYVAGDVVYVQAISPNAEILQYYTAIGANTDKKPPNSVYWLADQCAKNIPACRLRFDPAHQRVALPFGGFPGVAKIPANL
jgi:lambda family phage minor tail protein L